MFHVLHNTMFLTFSNLKIWKWIVNFWSIHRLNKMVIEACFSPASLVAYWKVFACNLNLTCWAIEVNSTYWGRCSCVFRLSCSSRETNGSQPDIYLLRDLRCRLVKITRKLWRTYQLNYWGITARGLMQKLMPSNPTSDALVFLTYRS